MKKGEYFCGEDFFGKMVLYIPPFSEFCELFSKLVEPKEGALGTSDLIASQSEV